MSEQTLAWILLATVGVYELLAIGYYALAGNEIPQRPWWYRVCGAVVEIAAVWLALKVVG